MADNVCFDGCAEVFVAMVVEEGGWEVAGDEFYCTDGGTIELS